MVKRRPKGEGSIFFSEKEKCWIAQVTLPDGSRKRKRSKRQQVVKDWLLDVRKSIQTGVFVKADQVTVTQYLERYYSDVMLHTLRPKTLAAYEFLIRVHIKPAIGSVKLSQLRPDQIQSLYSLKLNSGLSNRTVQFIHSILHKTLKQAVKWGLIVRNPADLVEPPSVKRKPPITWTVEQAREFLNLVKAHRFYPIYVLAMATGMREGELLGLFFEDVNFETGTIHVQRAIQNISGMGTFLSEPKTEKSKRAIPLPEYALQVLKEHCDRQNRNQGFIFSTRNGTPIAPRNLVRHFKDVVRKSNLTEIRFHDLRHYHATYLLSQNIHPSIVQQRLGHSSVLLTLDTYSHVLPSMQNEAAKKANEMFK